MKTIYNTYVPMENQEQCDRMKQIFIDNNLRIWKESISFIYFSSCINCVYYESGAFYVLSHSKESLPKNKTKVTESEWLKLLQKHNLIELMDMDS